VIGGVKETASQANELLRQIAAARRKRAQKEALLNARVQTLKDRHGSEIEALKQHEASLIDQLVGLVVPKFALLAVKGTKTIKLRSGEISIRLSPESLEVTDDEDAIIRRIRKQGGLRKFTRLGKRTLDKAALKKNPAFVARIQGLAIVRRQQLTIKLPQAQGEVVLTADALRTPLPEQD
jgi:phage host-nuclease inhibitor protein Gam